MSSARTLQTADGDEGCSRGGDTAGLADDGLVKRPDGEPSTAARLVAGRSAEHGTSFVPCVGRNGESGLAGEHCEDLGELRGLWSGKSMVHGKRVANAGSAVNIVRIWAACLARITARSWHSRLR
jgi:hypothetical protein